MTSATGTTSFPTLLARRAPLPGDVGHLGTCPLCRGHEAGYPPCLACRDEIRARVLESSFAVANN